MIYLDNAATTKIHDDVLEAMMPFLKEQYGNPGAIYPFGIQAAKAVENAREQVASLFNATPDQIIFTSGGTESNNTAILGVEDYLRERGKTHIVTTMIEHDSMMRAIDRMEMKRGFHVTRLKPNRFGFIDPEDVRTAIRHDTGLVSMMYVNNETGAVNPVREVGELCQEFGILFMTDCVQAAGCCKINVDEIGCDFASISSHKIHGPKGVGALYVRDKSHFEPTILGGGTQEFGLRGGTQNVAGFVGLGKACADVTMNTDWDYGDTITNSTYKFLWEMVSNSLGTSTLRLDREHNSYKIINYTSKVADAETLVLMLGSNGICISAGSACRSQETTPSRVLTSMGFQDEEAMRTVRISFSEDTTVGEVNAVAKLLKTIG